MSPSRTTTKRRSLAGTARAREESPHRLRGVDGEQDGSGDAAGKVGDGLRDLEMERVVAGVDRVGENGVPFGQGLAAGRDVGIIEGLGVGRDGAHAARRVHDPDGEVPFVEDRQVEVPADPLDRGLGAAAFREQGADAVEPGDAVGLPSPVVDRALGDDGAVVREQRKV